MLNNQIALLIVDFQADFLDSQGRYPVAKHQVEPILSVTNQLIRTALVNRMTTVYIGNEYNHNDLLNIFRNHAAVKGEAGTRLDSRLSVTENYYYFSKNKPSAFTNPQLDIFLREHDIKQILLTGVYASACIRGTAIGGLKHGYQVHVISDAVADANDQRREKALVSLTREGVSILPSSQVV